MGAAKGVNKTKLARLERLWMVESRTTKDMSAHSAGVQQSWMFLISPFQHPIPPAHYTRAVLKCTSIQPFYSSRRVAHSGLQTDCGEQQYPQASRRPLVQGTAAGGITPHRMQHIAPPPKIALAAALPALAAAAVLMFQDAHRALVPVQHLIHLAQRLSVLRQDAK